MRLLLCLTGYLMALWPTFTMAQAPNVIELTQTPCQFLEIEKDHGFKSHKKADCDVINAQTGVERLKTARVLRVPPGDYVFRVRNQNVPYELGFWLREKDYDWRNPLHKLTKTSVSGGGLTLGARKDYAVSLGVGTYLYSCPLNTTLDYTLIVENP